MMTVGNNNNKRLYDLLEPRSDYTIYNEENPIVRGVQYDSRKIRKGDIFIAIKGEVTDGNLFLSDAVKNGAVAVISENKPKKEYKKYWIRTSNARKALSRISGHFYDFPWNNIVLIGVTGTNGKTTVTYLIKSIFEAASYPTGVLGTIGYSDGVDLKPAERTTPEAPQINKYLADMSSRGVNNCVMEVSSHSLVLERVSDIRFNAAIFTNLTNEHLDFHLNLESYFQAKKLLFHLLKDRGFAVINIDDHYGKRLAQEVRAGGSRVVTYGKNKGAEVRISDYLMESSGSKVRIESYNKIWDLKTHLFGLPNLYNIATAVAVAHGFGIDDEAIHSGILNVMSISGRMEKIDFGQDYLVLVDYAHTPDAIMRLLIAVREITQNRIITVFGCGGDRDKTKRPMMGQHVAVLSNLAIVTNDNPRSEKPCDIIEDILVGIYEVKKTVKFTVIEDRREAIKKAIEMSECGDTVVIAGKGHEDYQIIGDKVLHFDDREVASEFIQMKMNGKL